MKIRALQDDSIQVASLGVVRGKAARFESAFERASHRLAWGVPRQAAQVAPLQRVSFPHYGYASRAETRPRHVQPRNSASSDAPATRSGGAFSNALALGVLACRRW
jgi:hypothetical protein